MFNKATQIIFILLANTILLAHSIVPHHHHQKEICLLTTRCQDEDSTQNHPAGDPLHERHGDPGNQQCILETELILPSASLKLAQFAQSYYKILYPSSFFQTVIFKTELFPMHLFSGSTGDLAEFSFPGKILYLNRSHGLRAPPQLDFRFLNSI